MSSTNERIIQNFYTAFQEQNADDMVKYYHKNIEFEDPAFGKLLGERAKFMWIMLCTTAKDLKITFEVLSSKDNEVSAKWEAHYTFSRTGRKVHNKIEARFILEDGLIVKHTDSFNLHKWASQAMGWQGILLGWTGFFRNKLNQQTGKLLSRFIKENK